MSLATRAQVRAALGNLLEGQLVGPGKLVQAVYPYSKRIIGGQTPVVALGSGSSEQKTLTTRGSRVTYIINAYTFVLYSEVDESGSLVLDAQGQPVWDEQDAEAALDAVDAALREALEAVRGEQAAWKSLDFGGPTQSQVLEWEGHTYYFEQTPVRVEVY